ncbi:hypothetical protein J6590_001922 [Homalodisca vitripennis]|nr:hypothetical protein J6590_001922 [Homalodisca vitripennis]
MCGRPASEIWIVHDAIKYYVECFGDFIRAFDSALGSLLIRHRAKHGIIGNSHLFGADIAQGSELKLTLPNSDEKLLVQPLLKHSKVGVKFVWKFLNLLLNATFEALMIINECRSVSTSRMCGLPRRASPRERPMMRNRFHQSPSTPYLIISAMKRRSINCREWRRMRWFRQRGVAAKETCNNGDRRQLYRGTATAWPCGPHKQAIVLPGPPQSCRP